MINVSRGEGQKIIDQQQNPNEWLITLHPLMRYGIGLFGSALLAWFVPQLLLVMTTGMGRGMFQMGAANAIGVAVLIAINILGNSLKKILLTGGICAILIGCYELSMIARTVQWSALLVWLPQLIIPIVIFILNAYLFVKFKQEADLG